MAQLLNRSILFFMYYGLYSGLELLLMPYKDQIVRFFLKICIQHVREPHSATFFVSNLAIAGVYIRWHS